ncbi:MAG: M28 family peptidase [Deltaproteobacteria bacterium]|nr:M28 family peptidase [Deltaproteobacteria bacterium]
MIWAWLLGGAVLVVATGGLVLAWMVQPLPFRPPPHAITPVDQGRLRATVRTLCTTYHPRSHLHVGNLWRIAHHLQAQLAAAGCRVEEQRYGVDRRDYVNVRAHLGPPSGRRIVVGAHYDACGDTPGADDNASGVAALVELAVLLGSGPLACHVELVAWTLEEPPHFGTEMMGSRVHARLLEEEHAQVSAVFALDMLGRFSDEGDSQRYPFAWMPWVYGRRGDFIAVVGDPRMTALTRRTKRAMRSAGTVRVLSVNAWSFGEGLEDSDHASYRRHGIPAVLLSDGAMYRHGDYHGAGDTADKLDYPRLGGVVQALHVAVLQEARRAAALGPASTT